MTTIRPRIYVKKMPTSEVEDSIVNTIKIGHMIEGDMGRMGINITSYVLTAMNDKIEAKRKRKNPIGKHDLTLEPWRLTAGRNLIAVLKESVEIRKEIKAGGIRYRFLLGEKTFLDKHTGGRGSGQGKGVGYWAMLNYGGKISIDAKGVPGYFGTGVLPSTKYGGSQSFHWTGSNSLGSKGPKGTKIGLMIPKKLITGIDYIAAGYRAFLKMSREGLATRVRIIKTNMIHQKGGGRIDKKNVNAYTNDMNKLNASEKSYSKKEIVQTIEQKAAAAQMSVAQYLAARQRGLVT